MIKQDEFEEKCDDLAKRAAEWIMEQLEGARGLGFRGTSDLESDIYGWLIDHAIFPGDED